MISSDFLQLVVILLMERADDFLFDPLRILASKGQLLCSLLVMAAMIKISLISIYYQLWNIDNQMK